MNEAPARRTTALKPQQCAGCAEAEQMLLRIRGLLFAATGRIEASLGMERTSEEAGRRKDGKPVWRPSDRYSP